MRRQGALEILITWQSGKTLLVIVVVKEPHLGDTGVMLKALRH